MKHTAVLLLPALFALASCGTLSQYSQQRFTDGVYSRVTEQEPVYIYSKDEFAAMANARIAQEKSVGCLKDTVYVVVDNTNYYNNSLLSSPYHWGWNRYGWYNPWYYGSIYYGSWYAWNWGWYDPWYDWGWYNPWYSYHYPYYHHHHHAWNPAPPRPGLSNDGRHYYGRRSDTYSGGQRINRPGSSDYNYRRSPGTSSGSRTYGSSGSTITRRGDATPSRVRGSNPSSNNRYSTPSGTNGYNYRRSSGSSFSGGGRSGGSMGGGGSRSGGGGSYSRGGGGGRR